MKLWKFKYLLLLLCLLSYGALAADRSIATITPSSKYCRLVFHNSPEDVRHHYLQQGSDYIVVYADELIPFKGKLVNTTRTDDGLFIHHFELPDGQVKEIANAEIASVAQLKGSGKPLIELPTAEGVNWGGRLKQAQGILGLYLKPFAPLARRGNIEVVGNLISSRKLAREVAEFVEEVDSHLVKFGLNPPDQTRIIINDRPIFEDVLGPAAVTVPVYNVWSREKKNLIHLGAWGKNTELLKNPSVIAHERVHSHFHVTHTKDAFVLKNQSIQEAFADFMAAHTLNDPRIAFDTIFPGVAMRDIQTRSFVQSKDQVAFMGNLEEITIVGYHDDSLLYSNVLWRIRQEIGPDNTEPFVSELIQVLNHSYIKPDTHEVMKLVRADSKAKLNFLEKQFRRDYHLFIASIEHVAQKQGHGQKWRKLYLTLEDELKIDPKEVQRFSQQVTEQMNQQKASNLTFSDFPKGH